MHEASSYSTSSLAVGIVKFLIFFHPDGAVEVSLLKQVISNSLQFYQDFVASIVQTVKPQERYARLTRKCSKISNSEFTNLKNS